MTKEANGQPLPWTVRVDDAERRQLTGHMTATPGQRAAIAKLAGLRSVERLAFDYEIRALGKRRFRLDGKVQAEAVRTCVITLASVTEEVAEPVQVEYWPEDTIAEGEPPRIHGVEEDDPREPIVGGRLDIGRVAYETFVAALDPYPRAPGAQFSWTERPEAQEQKISPFAALRKLKSS